MITLNAKLAFYCLLVASSFGLHSFSHADSLGNLAQYPPEGKHLTITTGSDGMPNIDPSDISLQSGNYYRLKIYCPDVQDDFTGWRIEMPELFE